MYDILHNEHEKLKDEKKKRDNSEHFTYADNIWLRAQINEMQSSRKDKELDEAKKEVEDLKGKLLEANDRERTLTNQLKEKEKEKSNKWNKQNKENQITSLKRELEEAKRIGDVLKGQIKQKEERCINHEQEIIALRAEVNKLKQKLRSSQVLENIINCQRSPFIKTSLEYIGETSHSNDEEQSQVKEYE